MVGVCSRHLYEILACMDVFHQSADLLVSVDIVTDKKIKLFNVTRDND